MEFQNAVPFSGPRIGFTVEHEPTTSSARLRTVHMQTNEKTQTFVFISCIEYFSRSLRVPILAPQRLRHLSTHFLAANAGRPDRVS